MIFDGDGAFRLFDVMAAGLQHLRRTHDPEYRGASAGREGRRRSKGTGRPQLLDRERQSARLPTLDRRTFTSPITSFSAATTAIGCLVGNQPLAPIRSTAISREELRVRHVIARNAVAFFHDGISVCTRWRARAQTE